MQRFRALAVPTYLVAALLVLFPVVDTVLGVLPAAPGEVSWRFGATGLFSRALVTPLLGMLLAFAFALTMEQTKVLWLLSAINAALTLAMMGIVGLFLLDALQVRAQVRPDASLSFDIATAVALGKYALAATVTLAIALAGWKASADESTRLRRSHPQDVQGLVVRSRPTE